MRRPLAAMWSGCAAKDGSRRSRLDRRSHWITVTEKGRDAIERAYPAWKLAQTEILRRLGAEGAATLKNTIRKLQVRCGDGPRASHRSDDSRLKQNTSDVV